jgi:hypothetical protein
VRLVTFFASTFAITWSAWAAAASLTNPFLRGALLLLGTFAPGLVALAMTGTALLPRLVQWQAGARWYVFAASYIFAIKLTSAVVHRLLTGAWPRFGDEPIVLMIGATIFSTIIGGQAGEELGWRGFALPRLAERLGLGAASVLLGMIWACWHLPLFFIAGTSTTGQSFPLYFLQVTALSVALAWLWARTNGSLLLTMFMHAAVNNTKDIVPSAVIGATHPFALSTSLVAWITVTLLWICALVFLRTMPSARSSAAVPDAVLRGA